MSRCIGISIVGAILLSVASATAAEGQPATTPADAASKPSAERAAVEWVDVASGKAFFTSMDIVRFDWDRQVFELTRERAMDLMSLPPVLQRDFVVRDAEGDIYRGCFMSMGSSFSYDGPTIGADFFEGARPPLYHIAGGYPGEHGPGAKRRFDPRLKKGLESAGLLRSIKQDEKVDPIEAVFCGWHGEALGCRVAITLFPETVRVGRDIRMVLRFTELPISARSPADRERKARRGTRANTVLSPEPDQVEARVTLEPDSADFRLARTAMVSMENLAEDSTSPLRVWPWSESGRSMDARLKAGPTKLTISIVAARKTEEGIEQVGAWDIPPRQVQVLPRSQ
jgi:hypothetical protein